MIPEFIILKKVSHHWCLGELEEVVRSSTKRLFLIFSVYSAQMGKCIFGRFVSYFQKVFNVCRHKMYIKITSAIPI